MDNPWVQHVLANMVGLAHERDTVRFSNEAMFSSRRMNSRLSAKEEVVSMLQEAEAHLWCNKPRIGKAAHYSVR